MGKFTFHLIHVIQKKFNVQYQETSLIYIPSELDIYYVAITSTANIH